MSIVTIISSSPDMIYEDDSHTTLFQHMERVKVTLYLVLVVFQIKQKITF